MTKPDSSKPETDAPDYSQMATDMLQMWQQGWKSYSDMMTKTAPAAEPSATADPFTGAPNWLEPWGRFMAGWAATNTTTNTPSSSPPPSSSYSEPAGETPAEHHAQPEPQPEQPAVSDNGPETISAAARSAPQPRDVLFAELVRRVEFLHERMVRMEAELERLKRRL